METGQTQSKDISVRDLFSVLWFYKHLVIMAGFFSLILSFLYLKHVDPKYKVEAVIEFYSTSSNKGQMGALASTLQNFQGFAPLASLVPDSAKNSAFIAKFLGGEFLRSVMTSNKLVGGVNDNCGFVKPAWYSVTGTLARLGLRDISPSVKQREEIKLRCFRDMFDIGKFKFKGAKTEAYDLSIEHEDAEFAANVLNTTIEMFFELEKKENQERHKERMVYLSEVLAELEAKLTMSKNELQLFLLKNPDIGILYNPALSNMGYSSAMMNTQNFSGLNSPQPKPFVELSNLESQAKINIENIDFLAGLNLSEQKSWAAFEENISSKRGLSKIFVSDVRKLVVKKTSSSEKIKKLNKLVDEEKLRLNQLLTLIKSKTKKKKSEVQEVLNIYKKIKELETDFFAKESTFESIKTTVKKEQLNLGIELLNNNFFHTRAVPPLFPSSPKNIVVVGGFGLLSLFVTSLLILHFRYSKGYIYTTNQIKLAREELPKIFLSGYQGFNLKYIFSDNLKYNSKDVAYFSSILERGKNGLILEIGNENNKEKSGAMTLSLLLAKFITSRNKSLLLSGISERLRIKISEIKDKGKLKPKDESVLIVQKGEISFLQEDRQYLKDDFSNADKEQLGNFDKILVSSCVGHDFYESIQRIKGCDYFILLSRVGKLTDEHLNGFFESIVADHEKCAGFVLLN